MQKKPKLLDGGLGVELQNMGHCVNKSPLWGSQLLLENPSAIKEAHINFLNSGCDVIITSSYQASVDGFQSHLGVDFDTACSLMTSSIDIAYDAIREVGDEFKQIAASIGPYGACLYDGSEYNGNYMKATSKEDLKIWHRSRMKLLASKKPDYFAIETIPLLKEAEIIIELLREFPQMKAWVSFSCKNAKETCAGDDFRTSIKTMLKSDQVVLVGANCCKPSYIKPLIESVSDILTPDIQFVAYPNSGKDYDIDKGWVSTKENILSLVPSWLETKQLGMVGGCCTVGPNEIKQICNIVKSWNWP